jgi:hypothetical protein
MDTIIAMVIPTANLRFLFPKSWQPFWITGFNTTGITPRTIANGLRMPEITGRLSAAQMLESAAELTDTISGRLREAAATVQPD